MEAEGFTTADWITIIILLATIVVIVFVPLIERIIQRRRTKRNACNALIREIEDTREGINTDKHPAIIREPDIFYRSAILNEDVFNGVLHSEVFMEFKPSTQNKLSNFYVKIRLRNEDMKDKSKYYDAFFLDDSPQRTWDNYLSKVRRYEKAITERENEIRNSIELILSMMNEEIP